MSTYSEPQHGIEGVSGEHLSIYERLILAPCDGRFEASPPQHYTAEGEYVLAGQSVGSMIGANGEQVPVHSEFSGWVMGFLVMDGQPVKKRQPVLWLRRL